MHGSRVAYLLFGCNVVGDACWSRSLFVFIVSLAFVMEDGASLCDMQRARRR